MSKLLDKLFVLFCPDIVRQSQQLYFTCKYLANIFMVQLVCAAACNIFDQWVVLKQKKVQKSK